MKCCKRWSYSGNSRGSGNRHWNEPTSGRSEERLSTLGGYRDGERLADSGREEKMYRSMGTGFENDGVRSAGWGDGGEICVIAKMVFFWLLRRMVVVL